MAGRRCVSVSDTEIVVHLVEGQLAAGGPLETAVQRALGHVKGANKGLTVCGLFAARCAGRIRPSN